MVTLTGIAVAALLVGFIVFVVWAFKENEKINQQGSPFALKLPEGVEVDEAALIPAVQGLSQQLESAMYAPKSIEYATANVTSFEPTQVYLHRVEELAMLMIYDPKLKEAEYRQQRWKISKAQLKKNYILIGEF